MLTPRHASIAQLREVKSGIAGIYAEQGLDPRSAAIAPLRHVCITDSKAEAADFIDNLRHQIRLSQSLRRREELLDGAMLIEKPYQGEPPLDVFSQSVLVGDPATVAERMAGPSGRRTRPCASVPGRARRRRCDPSSALPVRFGR